MPKFCANLSWLFTEKPLLERFSSAREAGFKAVEILTPYDINAQDIVNALAATRMHMALINCPPPNYTGGAPGFAAVPQSKGRFRSDFKRAVRYAKTLHTQHLHILAGDAKGPEAKETYIDNLRWATSEAPKQSLTIEPISNPGYFLNNFDLAMKVLAAVDAPNLHLQFDTYHAAKITRDVPGTWAAIKHRVAHIQIGQTPNRSEPGKGDIDFPAFFRQIDKDGYKGWVSGEYQPKTTTQAGLGWLPK